MGRKFNTVLTMSKGLYFIPIALLVLGGCKTVKNDIPPQQIVAYNDQQEAEAQDLLEQALQLEKAGNDKGAEKIYKTIAKSYLGTEAAAEAHYSWGKLLLRMDRKQEAFNKFKFVTKNFPAYDRYGEVMDDEFEVACQLCDEYKTKKRTSSRFTAFFQDPKKVIESFNHIIERAPRTEKAPKALYYIAEMHQIDNEKAKAIQALDQLIDRYPESPWAPKAYVFQGDLYLAFVNGPAQDQGMTRKAINAYKDFLVLFGNRSDLADLTERAKSGLKTAYNYHTGSRVVMGDFFLFRRHYPDGAMIFYEEARRFTPASDSTELAQERIQFIRDGKPIPTNWADKLFGKAQYIPSEKPAAN